MNASIIPFEQLSPQALKGVVEEFVTRDGTDYGESEVPLETKTRRIMDQLKSRKAVIVFDHRTESCTILESRHPAVRQLQEP